MCVKSYGIHKIFIRRKVHYGNHRSVTAVALLNAPEGSDSSWRSALVFPFGRCGNRGFHGGALSLGGKGKGAKEPVIQQRLIKGNRCPGHEHDASGRLGSRTRSQDKAYVQKAGTEQSKKPTWGFLTQEKVERGARREERGMREGLSYSYVVFSLGEENERADAGRDSRTCLARPNS